MSDQKDGRSDDNEAAAAPAATTETLSGRARTAPVIEGEAFEAAPQTSEAEAKPMEDGPAEGETEALPPEAPNPEAPDEAPAEDSVAPKQKSALLPVAAAIGVALLGAGGYYAWTEYSAPTEAPVKIVAAPQTAEIKPAKTKPAETKPERPNPEAVKSEAVKPKVETPTENKASAPAAAPVPAPAEAPKAAQKTESVETPAAETAKKAGAPSEPAPATPSKSASNEVKAPEAPEAPAEATKTPAAVVPEKSEAKALEQADDKAAQLAAQLAATQAALERVTQRLQAVEGQLSAPKSDTRAELAAREAGPASKSDASARIVVAQSLLTALRQGDDYTAQLAALQNLGGDPQRLERLRAGLSAPDNAKLAASFVALAPKIAAAVAPAAPAPAPKAAESTANFGEAVWSFVASRAQKLVRVRAAGAPDSDETAGRIDGIEQKLLRGDLAGALTERAQLPSPALVLTADWAKGAQLRLDAEDAGKAELVEALQALSKSKS